MDDYDVRSDVGIYHGEDNRDKGKFGMGMGNEEGFLKRGLREPEFSTGVYRFFLFTRFVPI